MSQLSLTVCDIGGCKNESNAPNLRADGWGTWSLRSNDVSAGGDACPDCVARLLEASSGFKVPSTIPEPEPNIQAVVEALDPRGAHKSHCCQIHGCKYGNGGTCPVETKLTKGREPNCQVCFDMRADDDLPGDGDEGHRLPITDDEKQRIIDAAKDQLPRDLPGLNLILDARPPLSAEPDQGPLSDDEVAQLAKQLDADYAEQIKPVLCDMCGSTTRSRCGRLGCV